MSGWHCLSGKCLSVAAAIVLTLAASAAAQEKGGEDETGPYEVAKGWPVPGSKAGYVWGSQPAVFAESPDRIFIGARGELKLPDALPRGYNGIWGSLGQRATEPTAEVRNCLVVVDRQGKLDGSILVADGLRNARVARFDKDGTFVSSDSFGGRTQKYSPAKSGDRTKLLVAPARRSLSEGGPAHRSLGEGGGK